MGIVAGSHSAIQAQPNTTETEQEQPLKFVGDFYGCQSLASQLQKQIVQTYISLATMRVLQQLGYRVEVAPVEAQDEQAQATETSAIQIRGVIYNV
jgi:hypothetical protein